ncbi:MAG: DUF21 domain-containing protein [Verrucomicrobiales bacterium]|nr:DUF21 domain-containing protein [Verrucomicrobiales bacterium]
MSWLLIFLCLTQSAMFSGLNLALFSISRLGLESETAQGNRSALKILKLRNNSNLLLSTILWGNVSVNVLLAMLSDSVMAGAFAFVFSTVGITFFGEIIPQAYFSRNAIKFGAFLAPVIRFYQFILYPVARPSAYFLDRWIGAEGHIFLAERDFEILLDRHITERNTDIGYTEGRGALNFLRIDDLRVSGEGAQVDQETIIEDQKFRRGMPVFEDSESGNLELIEKLSKTALKWAIFTDENFYPRAVLNADEFLRKVYLGGSEVDPSEFCHVPIVVENPEATVDQILPKLIVEPNSSDDRLVDVEVILYWGPNSKRIITGPDILGRLLHGIAGRAAISDLH